MISSADAWVLRCILADQPLNGQLDTLLEPYKAMGQYLLGLSLKTRNNVWPAMLAARPERDELVKALADVDPLGPQPSIQAPQFATAADIRKIMASVRWHWEGWIPASRVVGLASLEGVGKTRLAMDLCRRVYIESTWPDGQKITISKGTPSLWLASDGQHDEIVDTLSEFGLPDEAIIFPSLPDDPYGNTSLDSHRGYRG
jgi:hypothetical protein